MSDQFDLWTLRTQRGYKEMRDDGYEPDDYPRAGGYEYLTATLEQVAPFKSLFPPTKLTVSDPAGGVRFAHDPVYSYEWISGQPAFPASPGRLATPATPGYEEAEADIAQWRRMESDARTEVKNAGYSHRDLLAYEKDLADRMKAADARMSHLQDQVPPALAVLLIEAFSARNWDCPTSAEEVAEMRREPSFTWGDIPLPHEAYPASALTPYEEGTPRGLLEDAQQAYWELRRGNPDWDNRLEPFVVTYGLSLPLVYAQGTGLERFALAAGGLWDEVKRLEVLRRAVESILRPALNQIGLVSNRADSPNALTLLNSSKRLAYLADVLFESHYSTGGWPAIATAFRESWEQAGLPLEQMPYKRGDSEQVGRKVRAFIERRNGAK